MNLADAYPATITDSGQQSRCRVTPQNKKFNEGHLNKLLVERKPRRSVTTIHSSRKN